MRQLALRNPEGIASRVSRRMQAFMRVTYPVVHFLSFVMDTILEALRVQTARRPQVTEEEIQMLMTMVETRRAPARHRAAGDGAVTR